MVEPLRYEPRRTLGPRPLGIGYVVLLLLNTLAALACFPLLLISIVPSAWGIRGAVVYDAGAAAVSVLLVGASVTYVRAQAKVLESRSRRTLLASGIRPLLLAGVSLLMAVLTGDMRGY